MAELYAKPYEVIDTGYNPQQTQQGSQDAEMQSYLDSLPPEERQKAIERINAPLSGEELALMAKSGERLPTLEDYAEIEKFHKNHEVSFIDGLGRIAEGGEQVMNDLVNAATSFWKDPADATSKMPATAVEAFSQGTRNFYGMLAQSQNPDSALFRVKDFLNGTGTIEDRYNQYMEALKFNKQSAELAEGKQTLVMDKDLINHEVTQAMAYIADPTLFIPFGKVASTGLRAVGLGEKLALAGARSAAIKNGIIGNTIKWGAGQPLEFLGGAVRNTIDYGLERAGAAFEATTGVGAKEFAQTARMSGIGFSASAVAGHAVPYASTISDAYLVGSSARGFGEALTLLGDTMKKNQFGRGINSWAAESLAQAEKNGVALSPHAKGLLKTLNAVDPLFAYGWNGLEGAAEGALIGGGLGYLSDGAEGMYSGIGAGIALGGVGATAGKVVADVTGGTAVARRAVQAKMVIEGHKVTNPEKAMFFQAMQKAAEVSGKDVDLVNGIIAGIDNVAPNFEFHALTPDQFEAEAKKRGYNPDTGKFMETSALDVEFGGDRASKSKAMYVLRSVGGDFVGNRQGFLDALKKASAKDSANPNKPASNIPLNLRKYIDVAKTFEKLSKTQQEAILKEIDGQTAKSTELGGKTKLREYYDALTWSEAWTDSIVKKFESDREGAKKDIAEMLAQETDKNGKLNSKGRALADKLRAEGFLDKDNKLLRERNLLNADLTLSEFRYNKGAVVGREADGKTHMYINLSRMGDETFPHELFHTIMRESPMKKHFTDTLIHKLLGTVDKDGNLVRPAEVNLGQVTKFFKKYIDLTHRNDDGTLNAKAADEKFKQVQDALTEYRNAGENKKISDDARSLIENYTEEFGAYYFSHWLMGRNRNTLFFGGELKGIEGLVERAKDSFKDFWQSKISKSNPEFDFSRGLNEAFDRSKGLGRISAMDYYMRDMVRAASNANKEVFRPDSMTLENLRDFERSNGLRNLTTPEGTRRLNPREQVTQNIRLGKEAYKILSGLDKNLRTSKDVLDENGKQIITGRLSEAELDALVKGGIVPRAWADKVNQGYAMLDGTVSNIFSAGYLGRTEQTTDASWPRLTGKDVSFKNRKAVLFDVETKIKADGTFYTLFHTLDLAVIEQRGNHLWQNVDYRNLWNGDRAAFEADFFKYISNASKASTDSTKRDSAALLETGDGNGAKRRDVMHQMAGMALQTGDAYKHQPIAVIPEGIRHSVTTFNIDGMTMPRIETGTRYDINMGNAHKFIRENWQPDEMRQEKTPSGVLLTHESGFKFSNINGKTTAYTSAGKKIGTFDSVKQATEAAKREYHKVYDNIDKAVRESVAEQDKTATKFQPLDENERAEAIRLGDVFALQSMKDFVGNRTLLRQTREEHIYQRALEAIENPEQLLAYAQKVAGDHLKINAEYDRLIADITKKDNDFEGEKNAWSQSYYKKLNELRDVKYGYPSSFEDWKFDQTNQGKWNPPERIVSTGIGMGDLNPEHSKYIREGFARYEADAKAAWAKLTADPEYIESQKDYNQKTAYFAQRAKELIAERDLIDEFKKKNKEALESPIVQKFAGVLDNYKPEDKPTIFAKLVEASAKMKDYSGLLEALFAREYDDQIQTGKPFVAVTTHGTGNVELMLARLFAADKLGSHYDIPSSRMGSFSAGSQNTSRAYARKPQIVDRSPAARFKRLTSILDENGYVNKTTEQYKLTTEFIRLYRDYLKRQGYDEGTIDVIYRGFLFEKEPFKQSLELEKFPQPVRDAWKKVEAKDNESLPPEAPNRQMQLRKVIRMDNPYVVVDPRSYEEHYISPHMKRAIAAGHDGIIFKRFADGGQPDNVYVVFKDYMKDNIKVIDTSFDDVHVPRGNDESGRVLKGGKDLLLNFQPTEGNEGGRTYDPKSREFRTKFIGKWAEENPDKVKGYNIEFIDRGGMGGYRNPNAQNVRIRMQDNSKKGSTIDVGHITAQIDHNSKVATLSSNIAPEYRGNKLSYALYSEMAERLRSMGIKYVDGQIVNPEGIPVRVREKIIGDTRMLARDGSYQSSRPISQKEASTIIKRRQAMGGQWEGIDVVNELDFNARYQPTEGEQGGRTYTPEQMSGKFIGRYASDNKNITKGKSIYFSKDKEKGLNGGETYRLGIRNKNELHGFINVEVNGDKAWVEYANVDILKEGRGYGKLLYSEMVERLRSLGVKEFSGSIVDEEGRPQKIRKKIIDQENRRIGKPSDTVFDDSNEDRVHATSYLHKEAYYMPAEPMPPSRDQGFNRVYREISRSKKAASGTIKQSYLDRFGIRLKDYEELVRLEDALYRLERDYGDGKIDDDSAREQRKDLTEEIEDRKNIIDSDIKDKMGYGVTFEDHNTEIESGLRSINRIIDTISKKPLDKVDELAGSNRLEAVLKKELGSGFAQEIVDEDVFVANAFREYAGIKYEREMIGAAFESELYSSEYITPQKGRHHYTIPASEGANKKGILVDILRSENKLTDKGLPQGEVNPRRIINALRNKSGGDSKVYAEAKAIGLIDWLESKQEGKNQKKVTTKELIEFVENNKMGLEIDPQLEQNADFGDTRPYVTGGEEQAKKGYRVYVVRMTNANHEHGVEGHFNGAVVHVRVTLRDTKDGKKVMHIEEIQANNTATGVLSDAQRKIVTEEVGLFEQLKRKKEKILDERHDNQMAVDSDDTLTSAEKLDTKLQMRESARKELDSLHAEYAEKIFQANREEWKDIYAHQPQRDDAGYIKLIKSSLEARGVDIFISERETKLNAKKSDAPLQDPKEWVKVAFRTVLRKALVEGVDRITITPWSETPLQVGMKAKSAERFYGKTIVDAFNSELQKMNSRLNVENKSTSNRQARMTEANVRLNDAIQRVAKEVDVRAENNGADIAEIFKYLHMSDADLDNRFANQSNNYLSSAFNFEKWMQFELAKLPNDYKGLDAIEKAASARSEKLRAYVEEEMSNQGAKTPSGRYVAAGSMSESQYLVDRSMGFDLTPEMKKKAARPQRMFQPSEYTEFKSEQSPTGRILRNAKGYVIMMSGNRFRVYNPTKAIIGVYNSEDEAKKRIYREIPKQ